MTNSEEVAIILPVYNVAEYLDDALKSILNQTYKNYKIIAVNDGSTDNSLAILQNWKESFGDQLLIYTKENGGLSDARNYGLQYISDAAYVYFMDSDDMIHPDLLRDTVHFANKNQLDYVKFDYFVFNDPELEQHTENNKIWNILKKIKCHNSDADSSYVEVNNPRMEVLSKENFIKQFDNVGVWDCLIKASFFANDKEVRFPKGYIHEDLVFDARLLTQMSRFGYIHKQYYFYRQRKGSITNSELSKTKAQHSIESIDYNFEILYKMKVQYRSDSTNSIVINKIFDYNLWLAQVYFTTPMLVSLYHKLGYSRGYISKYLLKRGCAKSIQSVKKKIKKSIFKIS